MTDSTLYRRVVKKQNLHIYWKTAGTYVPDHAELPAINAQSVDDWETQLNELIGMIDPMFWPSFNGLSYRLPSLGDL